MIVLFVVVPVVAFYLLYDWDRMIGTIDSLLPRDHAPIIRRLAGEIDETLASFIRGMGTVCLILGSYYAVALMLVGLQFGLVVGAVAGIITFIPYVGALFGGALAIGLALFQFWGDWLSIALVAGIFVIGQVVEGNFLTPKLVGHSVGLHPVWLIFALSVFGALFGFVGMLVAVPLAAAFGVLARFATEQYRHSRLYRGCRTVILNDLAATELRPALAPCPRPGRFLRVAGERASRRSDRIVAKLAFEGKLILAGPPGAGKTHLAHVWAESIRRGHRGRADVAGRDPAVSPRGPGGRGCGPHLRGRFICTT